MMKLSTLALLLSTLLLSGCVSPTHDAATALAPACPGYRQLYQCSPWAISFKQGMKLQGHDVTLVYCDISARGKTVRHVMPAFFDDDGWWMVDNLSGPRQVDSFNRYAWATRIENFLSPMGMGGGEVFPSGDYTISNVRVVK